MVKAIAARHDWEHQGQRELFQAVDRLRRETGDTDIRRLFNVASVSRVAAKRTTGVSTVRINVRSTGLYAF